MNLHNFSIYIQLSVYAFYLVKFLLGKNYKTFVYTTQMNVRSSFFFRIHNLTDFCTSHILSHSKIKTSSTSLKQHLLKFTLKNDDYHVAKKRKLNITSQ